MAAEKRDRALEYIRLGRAVVHGEMSFAEAKVIFDQMMDPQMVLGIGAVTEGPGERGPVECNR